MANGVTVQGRALARNGAVTLIHDSITRSTCAAAVPKATASSGSTAATTTATLPPTDAVTGPTTGGSDAVPAILLLAIFLVGLLLVAGRRPLGAIRDR
jgi:hypothetical protein